MNRSGGRIPPELKRLIARCLAKQPDQRFQSASDLAFALRTSAGGAGEAPAAAHRSTARPCLAVLPLQNLSANQAETEYMVDGMTEALIADLAKIRSLRVVSRTTVMQFKDARRPLRQIARELQADAIVEGSVLLAGSSVRITVQLIHADTDEHLWAESYQRELRDVLVLQSEVARAVAQEINVALMPEEQAHFGSAQPVKAEAYDAYLKARYHINRGSGEDLKRAVEYLRQAIELDSTLALGYVGVEAGAQWFRSPIWKGGRR
jgi:TolB-like protein